MIDEKEVEAAVDWLRDTANEAAQKRAERLYLDEYRKVLRAKLMKQHMDLPVSAQQRLMRMRKCVSCELPQKLKSRLGVQ